MLVGIAVPQGYMGEFEEWEPGRAFDRMLAAAADSDRLGFDSLWLYDHFWPRNSPGHRFMFDPFISAAAIARETSRIRIGHLVACATFRTPAVTAKMASTLDVASGGRYELGLGAGWKQDEWQAFGYAFPPIAERLRVLEESVEIIAGLLEAGSSSYSGQFRSTSGAVNQPRGVQQPRIPLIIGGNGRRVTWRLAARYADELNMDAIPPQQLEAAMPLIREHCSRIGRDPGTLRISVHIWGSKPNVGTPERLEFLKQFQTLPSGSLARVDLIKAYQAIGVSRLQIRFDEEDGPLEEFANQCARAGVTMR